MYPILVTLHQTFVALAVGALFLQSLAVVMALRLAGEQQREGARLLQRRIHRFIYYPLLAGGLLSGAGLAWLTGGWGAPWLAWKLVLVVWLIGGGMVVGGMLRTGRVIKPIAIGVHVAILLLIVAIIFLAALRPF